MHLADLKNTIGAWSVTGLAEVKISHSSSKITGNCCLNRNWLSYQLKQFGLKKAMWYKTEILLIHW